MPKQVVQDEDLVHMHFVQGRYTIPRQFVQDKALESYYKQHVRDGPQISAQVTPDKELRHRHCVQSRYPTAGQFVQEDRKFI